MTIIMTAAIIKKELANLLPFEENKQLAEKVYIEGRFNFSEARREFQIADTAFILLDEEQVTSNAAQEVFRTHEAYLKEEATLWAYGMSDSRIGRGNFGYWEEASEALKALNRGDNSKVISYFKERAQCCKISAQSRLEKSAKLLELVPGGKSVIGVAVDAITNDTCLALDNRGAKNYSKAANLFQGLPKS
ncbi:hypothetical protein KKA18_03365 [Patescibacteria group bacterium]|nr:hypothetical protein [Patescibacteria group bacterium]